MHSIIFATMNLLHCGSHQIPLGDYQWRRMQPITANSMEDKHTMCHVLHAFTQVSTDLNNVTTGQYRLN